MAGFADLVAQSQPAYWGRGVGFGFTEGRTWSVTVVDLADNDDNPIDLSTGVTGTCTIWDAKTGAVITTLTFTGTSGGFTLTKAKADTAALADNPGSTGRPCTWGMKLDNGTISVQMWGPSNSNGLILDEDGATS